MQSWHKPVVPGKWRSAKNLARIPGAFRKVIIPSGMSRVGLQTQFIHLQMFLSILKMGERIVIVVERGDELIRFWVPCHVASFPVSYKGIFGDNTRKSSGVSNGRGDSLPLLTSSRQRSPAQSWDSSSDDPHSGILLPPNLRASTLRVICGLFLTQNMFRPLVAFCRVPKATKKTENKLWTFPKSNTNTCCLRVWVWKKEDPAKETTPRWKDLF